MPTPFPGMDPYLERAGIWQQVHADLIVDIRRFLAPLLRPHYYVAIEQSTYLTLLPPPEHRVGIPDTMVVAVPEGRGGTATAVAVPVATVEPVVGELPQPEEIKQRHLEIRDSDTHTVITTIEILSPANKIGQEGRRQYERKRLKVLGSLSHLVEIDLLRNGEPLPMTVPYQKDYRIVISRSDNRPRADVYLFNLRDTIPDFPIPLRAGETEPRLPLNRLLHDLYDRGSYDLMIDYQQPPPPPALSDEERAWIDGVIRGEAQSH